jgi:hypothetical protein
MFISIILDIYKNILIRMMMNQFGKHKIQAYHLTLSCFFFDIPMGNILDIDIEKHGTGKKKCRCGGTIDEQI